MDKIAKPAFSKLNPALVSVPQEVTVAAANFNLDFSLMKVEAPQEFLGVGDALSTRRRGEAEEGQTHITARKLGALFEALAPLVPHLYQAYGKRASAISSRSKIESHKGLNTGIFAPQVGPDGTSIWAAATSGPGAIAVHLLACMLAKIWKGHEATSLWVELADRRKQQINESTIENIATIMASKQTFSRQQLASWDASARSWLQTADADRRLQQTQLMLIINNVRLPVNSKKDPYDSVPEAWRSGMIAMDRLVQGIPQQVQDGAILLAMSSWHLYPNMEVLLEEIKDIKQHDELMNGALLTIPAYGAIHNKEGVFWSLPLARMRYYSAPVVVERQIASRTSRVTIREFWIIVLGVIISQWESFCPSVERLCGLIIQLSTLVNQPRVTVKWLKFLADAAQKLTSASHMDRLQSKKLLRLGMRWCSTLLNDPQQNSPNFFGLQEFPTLLGLIPGVEEKIAILREIAATLGAHPQDLLIRYRRELRQACYPYAFATALPPRSAHSKFSSDVGEPLAKRQRYGVSTSHIRWIVALSPKEGGRPCNKDCSRITRGGVSSDERGADMQFKPWPCSAFGYKCTSSRHEVEGETVPCPFWGIVPRDVSCNGHACSCVSLDGPECACAEAGVICTMSCHINKDGLLPCNSSRAVLGIVGKKAGKGHLCPEGKRYAGCYLPYLSQAIEETGERCAIVQSNEIIHADKWSFKLEPPNNDDEPIYRILLGDIDDAAIFAAAGAKIKRDSMTPYGSTPNINEVERFLSSSSVDIQVLRSYLGSWWSKGLGGTTYDQQKCSLQALTFATDLYDTLQGATVSIETAEKPLYEALWAQWVSRLGQWSQDSSVQDSSMSRQIPEFPALPQHDQNSEWSPWSPDHEEPTEGNAVRDLESRLAASFACLAMLETGEFNIDPKLLQGVLALSHGDSIYVRSDMISDPYDHTSNYPIRRVFGNLGRSEMAFLLPPSEPKLGGYDINQGWQ